MGGGAGRSPLVRQIMADTTGLTVALPQTQEPVLLGAAMLGAVAGGAYGSIGETMASMSALGRLSEPTAPGMAEFHRSEARASTNCCASWIARAATRCAASGQSRRLKGRSHDPELRRCADRFRAGRRPPTAARRVMPAVGGSCLNIAVGMARLGVADRLRRRHLDRSVRPHDRRSRRRLEASIFAMRRAASTRPRSPSCGSSPANRNMPSMMPRPRRANWTYRRGSIPFDDDRSRPCRIDHAGPRPGRRRGRRLIADARPIGDDLLRSELPAQSGQGQAGLSRADGRVCRQRRHHQDVGCRLRLSLWRRAYAAARERLLARRRSLVVITRGNNGAQAWHRKAGRSKSRRRRSRSSTPSAPATAFRPRCCSPCTSRGASHRHELQDIGADELRRALSFACQCAALTCTRPGADPPWRHEISWSW